MGYDDENFGKAQWNPLGDLIKPGDTVLLKPNLVVNENYIKENGMDCVITHPSLIRAVGDYCLTALKNKGRLIIGDAPLQSCDFEALVEERGISKIETFYKERTKLKIELLDFRNYKSKIVDGIPMPYINTDTNGIVVDLGAESEFYGLSEARVDNLRITNYPKEMMENHHSAAKHEYIIAQKALEADVIINMPKPKTHRYAGVTIALKNLVGVNANKECLPHYSVGGRDDNGDEYESKDLLKELYAKVIDVRNVYMRDGDKSIAKTLYSIENTLLYAMGLGSTDFFGSSPYNDTIWRTILDINKIVYFADKNGKLQDTPQRKMFIAADMIVSGHETGPLEPTPKDIGVIAMGENPVSFDEAVCEYMGYSYHKIPSIENARKIKSKYNFARIEKTAIKSNAPNLNNQTLDELTADDTEHFTPHPCWRDFLLSDAKTLSDYTPPKLKRSNAYIDENFLSDILINEKDESVYLYGAGMFTERLIKNLSSEMLSKISGIIGYTQEDLKKRIYGFKVCTIENIKEKSSIIISSREHQDTIYNRIKHLQSRGHNIIKLF